MFTTVEKSDIILYKVRKTDEDISQLIEANQNLVYYMLHQLKMFGDSDAESAAWDALWNAVITFDVFSDIKFSTYACTCIGRAINNVRRKNYVRNNKAMPCENPADYNILLTTTDEYFRMDIATEIDKAFEEYILNRPVKTSNVLKVWRASGYSGKVTVVAKVAGVSPSYCSRVMTAFRAYLGGILKKIDM